MRIALALCALIPLVLVGCGESAPSQRDNEVSVSVVGANDGEMLESWLLRCPDDGDSTCARLTQAIDEVPAACTKMASPTVLVLSGTWRGEPIERTLDYLNCKGAAGELQRFLHERP